MNLRDLGEFGLIRRIASLFSASLPLGIEGIGNDCAVIPFQGNLSYLITTDMLYENIHFIKAKIHPTDLGYKCLAINLSDLAAMGGKSQYAFLSLGLPPETSLEWVEAFLAGFHQLATQNQLYLLGGDTISAPDIVINILLMGIAENSHLKRRSQARPGDIICCTGYLGDSGAGLRILLEELPQDSLTAPLVQAHVRPCLYLEEGAWLTTQPDVHAMMDISDGLASDIQRIMEESHCGAHIQVDALPLSAALKQACLLYDWQAEELALTAGEDYCLLMTINPQAFPSLQAAYLQRFQRPLFPFGTILASPQLEYTFHGNLFISQKNGFDHFKS